MRATVKKVLPQSRFMHRIQEGVSKQAIIDFLHTLFMKIKSGIKDFSVFDTAFILY